MNTNFFRSKISGCTVFMCSYLHVDVHYDICGCSYQLCLYILQILAIILLQLWMKTAILSWLQNDGTRVFSKDQLKGKQLSAVFQPDAALVVFRAKAAGWNVSESCFPASLYREPPSSISYNSAFADDLLSKMILCVCTCSCFCLLLPQHSEPDMFNNFLRQTKTDLMATRYAPFWDTIVSGMAPGFYMYVHVVAYTHLILTLRWWRCTPLQGECLWSLAVNVLTAVWQKRRHNRYMYM